MSEFKITIPVDLKNPVCSDFFENKPPIILMKNTEHVEFIAWGDPISNTGFESKLNIHPFPEFVIKNISGHYYFIMYDKIRQTLTLGNSLFSILPMYYIIKGGVIILSDSPVSLKSEVEASYNKRFLLENILFNYQLFNCSYLNGVNLLPVNSFINILNGDLQIKQHTATEDFFVDNPKSWRKSVDELSDVFISSSKKYFQSEPTTVSLTGGFDGRTLVATAKYHKKKFSTYSFGIEESEDIRLAKILSAKAELPYTGILLDSEYIRKESLESGCEFIKNSSGGASFERAHYLYSARKLSANTKYLITGNFGSEIFRAAHLSGSLISSNLIRLFLTTDFRKAILEIESSPEFNWLNKKEFLSEWSQLKDDLYSLPCFNPSYRLLTANQKFYKVVFEEIFRKYYGAEIVNQSSHIINRTPYLDYDFIKALLETQLAGVYSEFFTNNPLKRFKGQVLYAHIIKKTYPEFNKIVTDKGYKPNDLLSTAGKLRIAGSFYKKKVKQRFQKGNDPYSVLASFSSNKEFWGNAVVNNHLFNQERIEKYFRYSLYPKDSFFIMLSQLWWYNRYLDDKLQS